MLSCCERRHWKRARAKVKASVMFAAAGRRQSEDGGSDAASVASAAEDDVRVDFAPGVAAFMQHHSAFMPRTVSALAFKPEVSGGPAPGSSVEDMGPIQLLWGIFQCVFGCTAAAADWRGPLHSYRM
jgi:hypothetical protein